MFYTQDKKPLLFMYYEVGGIFYVYNKFFYNEKGEKNDIYYNEFIIYDHNKKDDGVYIK